MKSKYQIAALIVFMLAIVGLAMFEADNNMRFPPLFEGQPAPVFKLLDTDGRQWDLSAMRGKVVMINFWATWCPTCKQEMPSIHNLNVMSGNAENFEILTILYQDSSRKAVKYFSENGFAMPILLDPTGVTAAKFGLTGVPETFIIDKKGIVRIKQIGPREFDQPDVINALNQMMAEGI